MQTVITASKATAFPLIEHELEASLDHFQMIILPIPAKLTKTIMNPKNSRHARMTNPLSRGPSASMSTLPPPLPILHSENRGIQGYAASLVATVESHSRGANVNQLCSKFSSFCAALTAKNFERYPRMEQRFRSDKGIIIDIVPFGGLADAEGFISWPPDNDPKMCVTGFEDALRDCLQIKINDTQFVNVVSLPGLAMLKLLAWADRHHQSRKDAQDLELFLRVYGDMSKSRLFGSEVALMEKHNFDIDMAGPELLGQDIGKIASDETKLRLVRIMNSHEEEVRLNEILVEQVSIYLPGRDYRRTEAILGCVLSGLIRQRN